jgi:DCN1-like protein 4/5
MTDLENLLILGRQPVKRPSTSQLKNEPYNRTMYWAYVADRKATFSKFYTYCFALAKPEWVLSFSLSLTPLYT